MVTGPHPKPSASAAAWQVATVLLLVAYTGAVGLVAAWAWERSVWALAISAALSWLWGLARLAREAGRRGEP